MILATGKGSNGLEPFILNYQSITQSESVIKIDVQYNGTGACTTLWAEQFTIDDLIMGNEEPINTYLVNSVLTINSTSDDTTPVFTRLVARDTNAQICAESQNYYRFHMRQGT